MPTAQSQDSIKNLTGEKAVSAAADLTPEKLADQPLVASAATAWFQSDSNEESASDDIEVNVGGPVGSKTNPPQWVTFKIQASDRDRIKQIREECTVTKNDGTREVDDMEANLRITVEGLLDPDLSKPENRVVRGQKFLDPGDALRARFAHKSGLIDQISMRIQNLSGYSDADVREVRAAKN